MTVKPSIRTISSQIMLPAVFAGIVAVIAHGRWPYAYYETFRWLIATSAISTAYLGRKVAPIVFACIIVAVVFNPISPLRMRAHVWQQYDIAAAIVMFGVAVFAYILARNTPQQQQ